MIYIFIILGIFIGELHLKNYIEKQKENKQIATIFMNKIRIRKYHNSGAFLNIMEKCQKILYLLSILFTLILTLFFLLTLGQKGQRLLKFGLSLLLGGAFSNTYDRLKRHYVVDYFSFQTPFLSFNRIVFNLSDFCIMIGAMLFIICHANS